MAAVTGVGGGPVRLAGPIQPGTAASTLFTAQLPTILRQAKITNPTSGTAVVGVGFFLNGSAAANQIGTASAGASVSATLDLDVPLNVGDTVQAIAGAAATLTTTLTGEVAGAGV